MCARLTESTVSIDNTVRHAFVLTYLLNHIPSLCEYVCVCVRDATDICQNRECPLESTFSLLLPFFNCNRHFID